MPQNIQQSLQNYITKVKKQAPRRISSLGSTTSKMLTRCKHPRSLSFAGGNDRPKDDQLDVQHQSDEAATLEDIDNFLAENFKSLYGKEHGLEHDTKKEDYNENSNSSGSESSGPLFYDTPRLADMIHGPHRFLTSSASSGSLLEGSDPISGINMNMGRGHDRAKNDKASILGVEECIAILTVSRSPYEDFKRSMEGVLDQRIHDNQRVDWDFMEKMLFRFLSLNEQKLHTFILGAFVDLVVAMRQD
ncbi:hypothetical protein vseg_007205 [Gypsophila vaccaria]